MKKSFCYLILLFVLFSNILSAQYVTNNVTVGSPANGLSANNNQISIDLADASHTGALSSTDWSTFNGKQNVNLTSGHIFVGNGSNISADVAMTGDVSITNTGATAVNTVTGTIPVTKGGTGLTTLTTNNVILGNGTSTPGFIAPGSQYNVLASTGTTWSSQANPGINDSQDLYVDVLNGDDTTGLGTSNHPYKTIAKAAAQALIILNGGTPNSIPVNIYMLNEANDTEAGPIHLANGVNLVGLSPANGFRGSTISADIIFDWDDENSDAQQSGIANVNIGGAVTLDASASNGVAELVINNAILVGGLTYKSDNTNTGRLLATNSLIYGEIKGPAFFQSCNIFSLQIDSTSTVNMSGGINPFGTAITMVGASTLVVTGTPVDTFVADDTGGTPAVSFDSASMPASTTGTFTSTLLSLSQYVGYTPAVSGNWSPVPANVKDALDQLAANASGPSTKAYLGLGSGAASTAPTNIVLELSNGHQKSVQTTPPVATVNANAGTGATCTLNNATDQAGTIVLVTTAVASGSGLVCDIAFNKTYAGVSPICTVTPANDNAALYATVQGIYPTTDPNKLYMNFAVADSVGRSYTWFYNCIETN